MPEREADLYPLSQTKTRVTIAIDQIKEAARAEPKQPRRHESLFMISNLFREGGPKVLVGVTDLDTRERLRFGPFSLSSPEDTFFRAD